MTKRGPKKNVAASVRARLMQRARSHGENFNFVLNHYHGTTSLSLGESPHEPAFVLKGAMLFTALVKQGLRGVGTLNSTTRMARGRRQAGDAEASPPGG
jgi:hypothetical protein